MIHIPAEVWRFLGFMSSVVGFICYALSSSFHDLFGQWTLLKIVLYSILGTIFSVLTLLVDKCPKLSGGFLSKAHVWFLALMLTSLYSFYEDRSEQHGEDKEKGRLRNMLSLVSFASFAFMSVSLSKQIQPEFDVGMSNFFLGCLIVAVMKMNIKIAVGVSALFYVLITVRSYWDSSNFGDTEREIIMAHPLDEILIVADNNGGDEEQGSHIEMPSVDGEGHGELTEEETRGDVRFRFVHPSPSPSTLRRRPVSLDSCSLGKASVKLVKTCHEPLTNLEWSPSILIRYISFKTLNFVSLSATEYWTLRNSDWDFTKALQHLSLLNFYIESRASIPSNAPLLPQLMGPDDEYFGDD